MQQELKELRLKFEEDAKKNQIEFSGQELKLQESIEAKKSEYETLRQ